MKSRSKYTSQSTLLRQEFLKKWIKGLYIYTKHHPRKRNMTTSDRSKAIKLSADLAIASTRDPKTLWSQSSISRIAAEDDDAMKVVVRKISEGEGMENPSNSNNNIIINCNKKPSTSNSLCTTKKKILKRSRSTLSRRVVNKASSIAKRLLKKKTQVLKSLVPGGEAIKDGFTLIKETLDYIVSLRVQVDVMRRLANAAERLDSSSSSSSS